MKGRLVVAIRLYVHCPRSVTGRARGQYRISIRKPSFQDLDFTPSLSWDEQGRSHPPHRRVPQRRKRPRPIPRRPTPLIRQAGNPPQQKLQLSVPRSGNILRDLMPRQINRHERQSPFRMRRPHHPRPGHDPHGFFGDTALVQHGGDDFVESRVAGDHELVRRRGLESLGAVPRHVLDCGEGAVGEEQVV